MKRFLVMLAACLLVTLSFVGVTGLAPAQAAIATLVPNLSMQNLSMPSLLGADAIAPPNELLEQLKSQVLPQFESILRPEQRDRLQSEIVEAKASLRKAFKKIALSSDQKTKLATVFKALPKKDFFASLTAEQKQGFFAKKELFKPTPEAISEKINAKMQMARDKGAMMPTSAAIGEKISTKMKLAQEKGAMPTPETIGEKISAKMKLAQEKAAALPTPAEIVEKISAKMESKMAE